MAGHFVALADEHRPVLVNESFPIKQPFVANGMPIKFKPCGREDSTILQAQDLSLTTVPGVNRPIIVRVGVTQDHQGLAATCGNPQVPKVRTQHHRGNLFARTKSIYQRSRYRRVTTALQEHSHDQ